MSNKKDPIEELKKAAAEDRVVTPLPKDDGDVLATDGEATLSLVSGEELGLPEGCFGLCLSNGGGFSSVFMNTEDWLGMRAKIDALLGLDKPRQ